jgi:hypothetical protein
MNRGGTAGLSPRPYRRGGVFCFARQKVKGKIEHLSYFFTFCFLPFTLTKGGDLPWTVMALPTFKLYA